MMAFALEVAVKGSLVLAASGLAMLLLRRRASASWRHVICSLAVGALLVLPMMSASLPAWEVPVALSPATPAVTQSASVPDMTARSTGIAGLPLLPAETLSTTGAQMPARPIPWALWLAVVYVAGVVMLVTHLAVARWSLRSIARKATAVTDPDWIALLRACEWDMRVTRPVRLLRSLEQTMPMAFGIRRPTILIPSIADTWSGDRRRAVLLHELAHIARHDCLTQFLASIAAVVYWPHPGVWWMARRLRVERELACDDRVLSIGTGARDYAEHLLELAYALGGSRAPALAVSMARPQQLEGRMLAVLDNARNRATPARRGAFISLAAALAMVMPLAAAETVLVEPPAPVPAVAPPAPAPAPATNVFDQRTPARVDQSRRSQERPSRQPGTWELRPSRQDGRVNLEIRERRNSSRSFTI